MKIIYISQLYNSNGPNLLYLDIAFLTVHISQQKDALNKNYYVVDSLDDRYFIGPKSSIIRDFQKGLKINNWKEPFLKDRPFNYICDDPNNDLYIGNIFPLLFEIKD